MNPVLKNVSSKKTVRCTMYLVLVLVLEWTEMLAQMYKCRAVRFDLFCVVVEMMFYFY